MAGKKAFTRERDAFFPVTRPRIALWLRRKECVRFWRPFGGLARWYFAKYGDTSIHGQDVFLEGEVLKKATLNDVIL